MLASLRLFHHISLVAQMVRNLPAMPETWVLSLGWEDPQEKGMATQFSILAWRISWTEKPSQLQSMWPQRVRHNWATNNFTFIRGFPRWHQWSRICLPMQEMQGNWVWLLGWEDPLKKEMAAHSSTLAWEVHGQRSPLGCSPWAPTELDMTAHTYTLSRIEAHDWRGFDENSRFVRSR